MRSIGKIVGGVTAVVALLTLVGCMRASQGGAVVDAAEQRRYLQQIEHWRRARMARLRAPDGWLSYVGSGRLAVGRHRIGHAADNDVVLPEGPDHLGTLVLDAEGNLAFTAAAPGLRLDGRPFRGGPLGWRADGRRRSREIAWRDSRFSVVRLAPGHYGWRQRDLHAPARLQFRGIEHFPVDPAWRIRAEWQPFAPPQRLRLLTSVATPQQVLVPGEARFARDGRSYRLRPVLDADGRRLLFMFTDRTSGKETFGGARYLRSEPPHDGRLVLDFNRAVNPPCALSRHVVCELAPPGNHLDMAVTAGEKNYLSAH